MEYAIESQGKAYTPSGMVPTLEPGAVSEYNRAVEAEEIARLKTAPETLMLYVHLPSWVAPFCACGPSTATELERASVNTWLGRAVASHVYIGPRRSGGFGYHTYRRAVSCRIFGTLYHGWFFESSGDYCRLRKAKRQRA